MIRPRGNLVLLEVDPEDRHIGKSKILYAPDEATLKFCRRCGTKLEALADTPGCAYEEEWKLNAVRDTYDLTDVQQRHDIVSAPFPVVVEKSRWATVLALGLRATSPDFGIGSRVLISAEAGLHVPGCGYRLVPAEALLAVSE